MAWLIYSARRSDSGIAMFWRPNSAGYTPDINEAGRYSEDFAKRMQTLSHGEDAAVPESLIGQLHVRRVVDLGVASNRLKLEVRP